MAKNLEKKVMCNNLIDTKILVQYHNVKSCLLINM